MQIFKINNFKNHATNFTKMNKSVHPSFQSQNKLALKLIQQLQAEDVITIGDFATPLFHGHKLNKVVAVKNNLPIAVDTISMDENYGLLVAERYFYDKKKAPKFTFKSILEAIKFAKSNALRKITTYFGEKGSLMQVENPKTGEVLVRIKQNEDGLPEQIQIYKKGKLVKSDFYYSTGENK